MQLSFSVSFLPSLQVCNCILLLPATASCRRRASRTNFSKTNEKATLDFIEKKRKTNS
ncbi:hypothetical protein [Methanimicrococcus hongohii]|uniref:hypothetical protein n=1 Tax=Methanimicrococcus hongohii TaxID=3028295 RepID=UPI00292FF892|nr:hypothetical protein [Methanimicrococcus sp. Hf6]